MFGGLIGTWGVFGMVAQGMELPLGYDFQLPPPVQGGEPVVVRFSIFLGAILAINEPTQSISFECILRPEWRDSRLQFLASNASLTRGGYALLNRNPTQHIWFPDIYVDMAQHINSPTFVLAPEFIRLYPDGSVLYSQKITVDLACPMDFSNYPVDVQHCNIVIESWGMEGSILSFQWNTSGNTMRKDVNLNQHDMEVVLCNIENAKYDTGTYPSILMRISLKRKLTYHLLRTYLPSLLFVTLAWLSMFIPVEHVPARVVMGMTALLTISAMFGSINAITPPVSYATKLDSWMVGCISFVFCVLVEFSVVISLKNYWINHQKVLPKPSWMQPEDTDHPRAETKYYAEAIRRADRDARQVDLICGLTFLGAMALFNLIYWLDIWKTYHMSRETPEPYRDMHAYQCFHPN